MAKTDTKTSNKKSKKKKNAGPKTRKGEEVRIGLSRSLAIQKRTKTLLKEYEQSGKSSVFVDKRIGERNDELGEFDKAIMRSQRQRQLKLSKKNKYNLSDEEEDELEISGFGPFSERDDFEDEMISDDDNDDDGDGENKMQSQVLWSMTEPSKMNALKALVSKDIPNEHVKLDGKKIDTLNQEQPDSYDKLVKEMALDMRATTFRQDKDR
ncbi:hypothetical protein Pint_23461 [Pistacia integerrima]|uniref:Uncharacterized protein n=1 Tax=Pistacia integerrima TaxID=434235 RepID=A0ACC0YKD7_9ROSI|nr:hypothetical protein Pint_23461 [Pistacia integerrima]